MGATLSSGPGWSGRRAALAVYFDRTAAGAWAALTSDAPVSWVRRRVRAGRAAMQGAVLEWLPADLRGRRVLDAGCGTGALAMVLAERGAAVVGVDVAASLVELGRRRMPARLRPRVRLLAGDMLDPSLGVFDHVVLMDSLIHYDAPDAVDAVAALAGRTRRSIVGTFAPRTTLLAAAHAAGRRFPRADRAPLIVPVAEQAIREAVDAHPRLDGWRWARTRRVSAGFYTSQAYELVPATPSTHPLPEEVPC